MMNQDVDHLFKDFLAWASVREWSGSLEASTGVEEVGKVVIVGGKIAWATCIYQPRNLGSYLLRLGHIDIENLDNIREEYDRHHGEVRLGSLLKSAGLISDAVLRRCLLLHIRMAISCLLKNPCLLALNLDEGAIFREETVFPLTTVFPESDAEAVDDQIKDSCYVAANAKGFEEIGMISGYRGLIVANCEGRVLAIHGFKPNEPSALSLLAAKALSFIDSASDAGQGSLLGEVEYAYMESQYGTTITRWLDSEHSLLVALFLDRSGKVGAAKYKLAAAENGLREYVAGME